MTISRGLMERLRATIGERLPLPGRGNTALRHRRLMEVGFEDLSLARLAEAHWDAVSILAEAGREPEPNAVYGVWASEKPGEELKLESASGQLTISGAKMFCSGTDLIDRALVTVRIPEERLIDVDLRPHRAAVRFDTSGWKSEAFAETRTGTAVFSQVPVSAADLIGEPEWYLSRPGFWHGACGPACCWAGGAAGLVDYARQQTRSDPHTLAHLGAMEASIWALQSYLEIAGREIDQSPEDALQARIRALTVRHLVEQACSDVLRRLPRAYGPSPLAFNGYIARGYQELDLYLRQSHAERDLEALGSAIRQARQLGHASHYSQLWIGCCLDNDQGRRDSREQISHRARLASSFLPRGH